jgi:predicted RNA binding protein YcfA (HicA-like mRNA interferase family)
MTMSLHPAGTVVQPPSTLDRTRHVAALRVHRVALYCRWRRQRVTLEGVSMPNEVTVRGMTAWLLRNGFQELTGKKTGHRYFQKDNVKITLPGHGPNDLTKKHVGMILRELERLGYDRREVRNEL